MSRPSSSRRVPSKPTSSAPSSSRPSKRLAKPKNLEDEYMRMNAELEKQAASLIQEADAVLKHQEEMLRSPIPSEALDLSFDEDDPGDVSEPSNGLASSFRTVLDIENHREVDFSNLNTSSNAAGIMPATQKEDGKMGDLFDALSDVDNATTVRLLKAQLRATQSECDTAIADLKKSQQQVSVLKSDKTQLTLESTKFQKAAKNAQSQLDQYRTTAESSTRNFQQSEAQGKANVKELESLKRLHKQSEAKIGTMQVRLNRANEELEMLKRQKLSSGQSNADTNGEMRKALDATKSQNTLLLAQRKELLGAFKKQLQLIDVLKRQKMHVEAARVLQFSEEEFVKALDWGADK